MSKKEIQDVIESQSICRMAFIDKKYPYIAPFQYCIHDDAFYFHFTDYGKKMRILEEDNHVCISIEKLEEKLSEYYFISIQGKLIELQDNEKKKVIIKHMVEDARNKFSKSFLAAHGYNKENGWDAFQPDESILIYKL
ncbi:MAG: pyridoxamine 5'-phosphate oxidase family protein, partial [Promethearchaeia archaeon]